MLAIVREVWVWMVRERCARRSLAAMVVVASDLVGTFVGTVLGCWFERSVVGGQIRLTQKINDYRATYVYHELIVSTKEPVLSSFMLSMTMSTLILAGRGGSNEPRASKDLSDGFSLVPTSNNASFVRHGRLLVS